MSRDLGLSNNQIILNVVSNTLIKKKTDNTFIFVDDSAYNIEQSKATHNLVLDAKWNSVINTANYERYASLNSIIDRCEELLTSSL